MSKRTIYILIAGGVIFLLFIALMVGLLKQKSGTGKGGTPTPAAGLSPTLILTNNGTYITPYVTSTEGLKVVKMTPQDKATGVNTGTKIVVEFNKPFNKDAIIFTINPDVNYTLGAKDTFLTVTFTKSLASGITYTFKVDPKETFPHTYAFTTEGPAPKFQPDTRPQGAAQVEDDFNKSNNPDVYVANRMPHEEATFKMVEQYNQSTRKFDFIVTVKGGDKQAATDAVNAWFQSIGLSVDSISKLKITYQ